MPQKSAFGDLLLHFFLTLSRRHERHVVVLVDDWPRDVGVQDVEAEGEDAQLDQPVVALGLLGRPPTHQAKGDVEH